jgi:large subunit ribosomal protein L24
MGGTQMIPGGIVARASAVDVSNVMLVCPVCKKATRVGVRHKEFKGEQVRVRYCKRADCGQEIDR